MWHRRRTSCSEVFSNFLGSDTDRMTARSELGSNARMLWTLFVLLLLVWMICVLVVGIGGLAIHLLLVVAAIVLLSRLVGSARK